MNVELKHKIDKRLILNFEISESDIEIVNVLPGKIQIKISEQVFDFLEKNNYSVLWETESLIAFSQNTPEEEIQKRLKELRVYYLIFSVNNLDDKGLDEFYEISFFSQMTNSNKEIKKVKDKDTFYKMSNVSLILNGKEVNILDSVINEKIIYRVMNENDVKKQLLKSKVNAKFSHYVSGNLYYTVKLDEGVFQFPIATVEAGPTFNEDESGLSMYEQETIVLSSDLGITSFYNEMRGSELSRWISKSIKSEDFIKVG